jgi:hypothetical protein
MVILCGFNSVVFSDFIDHLMDNGPFSLYLDSEIYHTR